MIKFFLSFSSDGMWVTSNQLVVCEINYLRQDTVIPLLLLLLLPCCVLSLVLSRCWHHVTPACLLAPSWESESCISGLAVADRLSVQLSPNKIRWKYLSVVPRQTESRNSRGSDLGFLLTLSLDCYNRTMLIHFCPTQLISDLLNLALTHQVSQPGLDLQPGQASLMAWWQRRSDGQTLNNGLVGLWAGQPCETQICQTISMNKGTMTE